MNRNIEINFKEKALILTSTFANKAKVFDTPENKELCKALEKFPNYAIKTKAPVNKNNYNGLSIEFMKKCVLKEYGEEAAAKFEEDVNHYDGQKSQYGRAKAIFFGKYENCKKLVQNKSQKENDIA